MFVKKFQGKTEEEVRQKYLKELGPEAVVLSLRLIQPKGLKKLFCSPRYEAIVAIESTTPMNFSSSETKHPSESMLQCILEQNEERSQDKETLEKLKKLIIDNNSEILKS